MNDMKDAHGRTLRMYPRSEHTHRPSLLAEWDQYPLHLDPRDHTSDTRSMHALCIGIYTYIFDSDVYIRSVPRPGPAFYPRCSPACSVLPHIPLEVQQILLSENMPFLLLLQHFLLDRCASPPSHPFPLAHGLPPPPSNFALLPAIAVFPPSVLERFEMKPL
eukprot:758190-Hanusia_phi.AAC.4